MLTGRRGLPISPLRTGLETAKYNKQEEGQQHLRKRGKGRGTSRRPQHREQIVG